MKPKRKFWDNLSLSENFELAMLDQGLKVSEVSRKCGLPYGSVFSSIKQRDAVFPTGNVLKIAKALGFTEEQVHEKIQKERVKNSHEVIETFNSKISIERKEE